MQEFSEMVLRLNGRETTDSFDLVFAKSDGAWSTVCVQDCRCPIFGLNDNLQSQPLG